MAKYLTAMNHRESMLWALGSQGSSSLQGWPLSLRWKKEVDTEGPRTVGRGAASTLPGSEVPPGCGLSRTTAL